MSVEIRKVESKRQLKTFVKFPEKLYKHNPYYVPNLVFDEMKTLSPSNPVRKFCECELYLAYKDGKLAGRVCAIVNTLANKTWNHPEVRFGWIDFIDDPEVSQALIDAVVAFGKKFGMTQIVGPIGFVDMDPEGMLIEGFDQMSTMATIYNYEYYPKHIESMGFRKDIDSVEYKIFMPEALSPKMERVSRIVSERAGVHIRQVTRKMVRKEDYGRKVIDLIQDTYKDLYNYTIMPQDVADSYLSFYLSILDLNYVSAVENEKGELVAVGIMMPSIAKALQKSRGELFPFGWIPLVRDMFLGHSDGCEFLIIGVRPDYRNTGINSLIFADFFKKFHKWGTKWAESNPELETNNKMQSQWTGYDYEQKKRRRFFIKEI